MADLAKVRRLAEALHRIDQTHLRHDNPHGQYHGYGEALLAALDDREATAPSASPLADATGTATGAIREAARLIRERANRAAETAPGEWYADYSVGVYAHGSDTNPDCPKVFTDYGASEGVTEHIAGFGPLVAVAIADWLDDVADNRNGVDRLALAVARAYRAPTA